MEKIKKYIETINIKLYRKYFGRDFHPIFLLKAFADIFIIVSALFIMYYYLYL